MRPPSFKPGTWMSIIEINNSKSHNLPRIGRDWSQVRQRPRGGLPEGDVPPPDVSAPLRRSGAPAGATQALRLPRGQLAEVAVRHGVGGSWQAVHDAAPGDGAQAERVPHARDGASVVHQLGNAEAEACGARPAHRTTSSGSGRRSAPFSCTHLRRARNMRRQSPMALGVRPSLRSQGYWRCCMAA